jgi:hypothetical protein
MHALYHWQVGMEEAPDGREFTLKKWVANRPLNRAKSSRRTISDLRPIMTRRNSRPTTEKRGDSGLCQQIEGIYRDHAVIFGIVGT